MKKLLILIIFLITGCTNYTELNNIGVVDIISIEKQNNEYQITINIQEMEKELTTNTYQSKGKNIIEIFNNINLSSNKKLNFSHIQVLLINSTITNNEIKEIIEYLKTDNEFRNDFNTIYTENIKDIMSLKISGKTINQQIIENNKALSNTSITPFEKVIKNYFYNINTVIPSIINNNGKPKINNYHILSTSYELTEEEGIVYNYLTDNISKHSLTISCLSIQIDNSKTLISETSKNTIINITSDIYLKDKNCPANDNIKNLYENKLKKLINDTLIKFKEYNILKFNDNVKITINGKVTL